MKMLSADDSISNKTEKGGIGSNVKESRERNRWK